MPYQDTVALRLSLAMWFLWDYNVGIVNAEGNRVASLYLDP